MLNLGKFHNVVRLVAFCPFSSSQVALENANAVSEGELDPPGYVISGWLMVFLYDFLLSLKILGLI